MRRITRFSGVRAAKNPRARSFQPRLEILEDRTLPSANPAGVLSAFTQPGVVLVNAGSATPSGGPGQPSGFSPQQISQAYGFNKIAFSGGSVQGNGAGQTIAIVDAYSQPNIASDLQAFDLTYGLAAPPNFTVVNQNGGSSLPAADQGWGLEISLDVEWAHAIAPQANILLVEASSNSDSDLLAAVNYARYQPGVSVVSMSWGGGEWSSENLYDGYFTTPTGHGGVTFVASSGDNGSAGAPEFPSVSPNILAVGGTQLTTDGAGNYLGESGWGGSGGGLSAFQGQPSYQRGIVTQSSNARAVPDVSYAASPSSPFAVYDTLGYGGWLDVGGTSAGAPQWAALIAIANQGRALAGEGALDGATQTLPAIYQLPQSDFHDVTIGSNGGYSAGPGYDLVTGRGTPLANLVVAGLVSIGGQGSNPPWVVAPASATPTPVSGVSTNLSVRGNDASGAANLTYTWTVLAAPSGAPAPTFSANGTNAAQNTTVAFHQAGVYTFQAVIVDPSGWSVTSNVTVTVNQTLSSLLVIPGNASVANGGTQQFMVVAKDQFGSTMNVQPTWTLQGAGQLNGNGTYLAPSSGTGSAVVGISVGGLSANTTLSFGPPIAFGPGNPWSVWINLIDNLMAELAQLQSFWQTLLASWKH